MITYEDSGLRVAECCWDEVASPVGVDLLRMRYRSESAAGDRVEPCPTLRVSLRVVENPLHPAWDQLGYVFEPESAQRFQRGMGLNIDCRFNYRPVRHTLGRFLRFADVGARLDGCSPAGMSRMLAFSEAGCLCLSTASASGGRVLATHCYLYIGARARLIDGAFAAAVDGGSPEEIEDIRCVDRFLLYVDIVTLQESGVESLELPVPDSASGVGLRGTSLTLYNVEQALSAAGRRFLTDRAPSH